MAFLQEEPPPPELPGVEGGGDEESENEPESEDGRDCQDRVGDDLAEEEHVEDDQGHVAQQGRHHQELGTAEGVKDWGNSS